VTGSAARDASARRAAVRGLCPTGRAGRVALSAASVGVPLAATVVLLGACGDGSASGGAAGAWRAQVDTVGDTIVVRTLAGSEWGANARLVEELRIGELEGREELTFGSIRSVAPAADGRVFVLDNQVPVVRVFGADGAHLYSFGRRGSGPGEMVSPDALALLPDGRVLVRDPRNARISVYAPDGEPLTTWRIDGTFATSDPMYVDTAGRVYTQVLLSDAMGENMVIGLQRFDDGVPRDTIRPPTWNFSPAQLTATREDGDSRSISRTGVPFTPAASWGVSPHGHVVGGLSTRYAVETFHPDGRIVRFERTTDAVPVQPGERAFRERQVTRNMRNTDPNWRWSGPAIPATKPPFSRVRTDADGRIWVQVATPGEIVPEAERPDPPASGDAGPEPWRDPMHFDVFESDGRFLGSLRAPAAFTWMAARGDHVWGVARDEFDVPYVVRLRIER
jgi:hypothetical protein